MSISINSFTPDSAVAPLNGVITFEVSATSSLGQSLNYQWQISSDGTTWTDISGEIFSNYTTPSLTLSDSGKYYRVRVYTIGTGGQSSYEEYAPDSNGIQITVTSAITLVFVTSLEASYSVAAGATLSMISEASLTPANEADEDAVNTISLQWEYSDDNGATWQNVPSSQYTAITETVIPVGTTGAYVKRSVFTKTNVGFDYNQRRYRVVASSSLSSSPATSSSTVILVASSINVTKQPGTGSDVTNCFKWLPATNPNNTGKANLSISANSTAGIYSNLTYQWYYTILSPLDPDGSFVSFGDGSIGDDFFNASGSSTPNLSLTEIRWIGSETPLTDTSYGLKFYCLVEGTAGETAVASDIVTVTIEQSVVLDVEVQPVTTVEDIYGDVANRDTYPEAIQNATFTVSILDDPIESAEGTAQSDGFPYTIQWQRKNPGGTTWNNVGNLIEGNSTSDYTTPPLKRTLDNGAYYRAKVEAANSNNSPKYSPDSNGVLLTVYNAIYITNQPTQTQVYVNQTAAFAIGAVASSSGLTITYQWQYRTSSVGSWINLTNNSQITGATTNLLVISNVGIGLHNYEYRCIVNTSDTLSSVTSSSAKLVVYQDTFNYINSLNDQYLLEFQALTWTVVAQSASLSAITYEWQYSSNYTLSTAASATWTAISGATSNTYNDSSVSFSEAGYYRCKLTSNGGTVGYTNVVRLFVTQLNYTIITNYPSTLKILEGQQPASGLSGDSISFPYEFSITAQPSISTPTTYQWQYSTDNGSNWINYGSASGYQSADPDSFSFIPQPFSRSQNGIKIRCKVISTNNSIPGEYYSSVCTVTVDRRFYYNAGPATLVEQAGNEIRLNLNSYQTGGTPTFQWQRNTGGGWSNISSLSGYSGETSKELVIQASTVTTSINGHKFRCIISLTDQDSHEYFRSSLQKVSISPAGTDTATAEVTFSIQTADLKKAQYSELASRTGAAIGTVICIPKPSTYTTGQTGDDTTSWLKQASGTSDGMYDTRFPGFVPLGYTSASQVNSNTGNQLLQSSQCPDLARIMGNVFGGSTTATYISGGFLPPITSSTPTPISGTFGIPNVSGKKLMGTGNVNNNAASASVVPRYDALGAAGGTINAVGSTGGQYNYLQLDQLPAEVQGGPSGGQAGTSTLTPATFTLGTFATTGWGEDTQTEVPTSYTETVSWTAGALGQATIASPTVHTHAGTSFSGDVNQTQAWATSLVGTTSACRALDPDDGEFLPGPAMSSGGGDNSSLVNLSHTHGISLQDAGDDGAGHGADRGGVGSDSITSSFNQLESGSFVSSGQATLINQSNALWNANLKFTLKNSELIGINQRHFRLKFMIKAW